MHVGRDLCANVPRVVGEYKGQVNGRDLYELFLIAMRRVHVVATVSRISGSGDPVFHLVLLRAIRGQSRGHCRRTTRPREWLCRDNPIGDVRPDRQCGRLGEWQTCQQRSQRVVRHDHSVEKQTVAMGFFPIAWRAFLRVSERLRGPNLTAMLGLLIALPSDISRGVVESNMGHR